MDGINWDVGGPQNNLKRATLMNYAINNMGMDPDHAAAMIGHADVESNFRPGSYNPTGERSHGLFQLNEDAGRWTPYTKWAAANNKPVYDPFSQMDYAKVEAQKMGVWDKFNATPGLAGSSRVWMDDFENPKVKDYSNRINAGQAALSAFQASPNASPPSSMGAPGGLPAGQQPGPNTPAPQGLLDAGTPAPNTQAMTPDAGLLGAMASGGMPQQQSPMSQGLGQMASAMRPAPSPDPAPAAPDPGLQRLQQQRQMAMQAAQKYLPAPQGMTGLLG